jgi:4-hydroxybenzoate polyprenyltransferase
MVQTKITSNNNSSLLSNIKYLLGLSRTFQATLGIAQPALAAVLALNAIPCMNKVIIGFITAWCGSHATFALNDYLDMEMDKKRFAHLKKFNGFDIDSMIVRHPLAQGYLTKKNVMIWITILGLITLIGAYWLSPVAAILFLVSVCLEIWYCKMAMVSAWKFLPSGIMVALGALAGWFAVTNRVDWPTIFAFLLWMYAWEVGGRNIVNDWSDVEEDRHLGIKTIPVVYGLKVAGGIIILFGILTILMSFIIGNLLKLNLIFFVGAALVGGYTLLLPELKLIKEKSTEASHVLFNRASFYPILMLFVLVISLYVPKFLGDIL